MSPVINTDFEDMTEYEQLVSRLEHIDRAFIVRRHIKLHYAKQMPDEVTTKYIEVIRKYPEFFGTFEESLLWFLSVELHSRFLAGSELGLYKYISNMGECQGRFRKELSQISSKHQDVINYIKTQRDKFLTHADNVSWKDFPNVFDKELESLLNDLKKLLNGIGEIIGEQRRVVVQQKRAETHTKAMFDSLLALIDPDVDIRSISRTYDEGVKDFLRQ